MIRNILVSALFLMLVAACNKADTPNQVGERALMAYLRCSLTDLEQIAQPQVVEQMRWRLSNLSGEEMQQLLAVEPQVSTDNSSVEGNTCHLLLNAKDALLIDSIGQPAHVGNRQFSLVLVKDSEKGTWRVESLEESE